MTHAILYSFLTNEYSFLTNEFFTVSLLKGDTIAKAAQLVIEYDPQPMFHSGNYLSAGEDVIRLSGENMEREAKRSLRCGT